jgi:hypothetical protein
MSQVFGDANEETIALLALAVALWGCDNQDEALAAAPAISTGLRTSGASKNLQAYYPRQNGMKNCVCMFRSVDGVTTRI